MLQLLGLENKERLMIAVKSLAIVSAITLGIVNTSGFGGQRDTISPELTQQGEMSFLQVLTSLGSDYGVYFTVEQTGERGEPVNFFESKLLKARLQHRGDLLQELEELHRTLPTLTYEVSKSNSQIIHFIDARLRERHDYALEQTIRSIDFTGMVFDLVDALGKRGIAVSPRGSFDISNPPDLGTQVHVRGEGLRVRDALSNFVPLERRTSRILWISCTELGEGETSYVLFYGAPRS